MIAMPSLFLSHGTPTLATESHPVTAFWRQCGLRLGRPRAVLVISAHWQTVGLRITTAEPPTTLADFYGFPPELYTLRYAAPGAPDLVSRIADLLKAKNWALTADPARGLDHGVWVPLWHLYPAADIPVAQLSLPQGLGPESLFALGQVLGPLRAEGVLILGSGGASHNLRALGEQTPDGAPPLWVSDFTAWLTQALILGHIADLWDYRRKAPYAVRNHPTDEHLLPLFVALGAAAPGNLVRHEFAGALYGSLAMDSYSFDGQDPRLSAPP
ncbi:MAG: dioxygenase family protein [Acidiferrobacter sp.]